MFSWPVGISCAAILHLYALCLMINARLEYVILTLLKWKSFLASHIDHRSEDIHTCVPIFELFPVTWLRQVAKSNIWDLSTLISVQSVKIFHAICAKLHCHNRWLMSSSWVLHHLHQVLMGIPLLFKKSRFGRIL